MVSTTQPSVRRTPILTGTPTNATDTPITIPPFTPNRRRGAAGPTAPQQAGGRTQTPQDITAGILEAGRRAQQEARQAREGGTATTPITSTQPPAPVLLTKGNYLGHPNTPKPAPTQQKSPIKTPPKNPKKEEERGRERVELWVMLDAARVLLRGDAERAAHRTANCHRFMVPTPSAERGDGPKYRGVDVHHTTNTADGTIRTRLGNLITCSSVWACPICSARVSAQRAADVQTALQRHRTAGGRLMFVTLTHQHSRESKLADQLKRQSEALKFMQEGRQFKTLMHESGVLGMIRGLEMTHSDRNGWHVHLHFLVLLAGTEEQAQRHADVLTAIDAERAEMVRKQGKTPRQKEARQSVGVPRVTRLPRFGRDLITCWQQAAKRAGLYAHRDAQNAVIASDDDQTLEQLARYLTKCELKDGGDGEKRWVSTGEDNVEEFGGRAAHQDAVSMVEGAGGITGSIAHEITMLSRKGGKGQGSRTPMGMLREYALGRIPKADTPERRAQDRAARRSGALFAEYVAATKGKNALSWGQGLKRLYLADVDDVSDEDAAQVVDENTEIDRVLLTLTPDEWQRILYAPRGARGTLLEVARDGDPDRVREYVATLRQTDEQQRIERRERAAMLHRLKRNHTGGSP